jgi:hypothetical protein
MLRGDELETSIVDRNSLEAACRWAEEKEGRSIVKNRKLGEGS